MLRRHTSAGISPCPFLRCHRCLQMTGKGDVDKAALLPWLRLHDGAVTGLSVRADARRLLTVGLDGRIFVVPTDTEVSASLARQQLRCCAVSELRSRAHIFRLCSALHAMAAVHECSRPAAARGHRSNKTSSAKQPCKHNNRRSASDIDRSKCRPGPPWNRTMMAAAWCHTGLLPGARETPS